jgi:hypothetical protein
MINGAALTRSSALAPLLILLAYALPLIVLTSVNPKSKRGIR